MKQFTWIFQHFFPSSPDFSIFLLFKCIWCTHSERHEPRNGGASFETQSFLSFIMFDGALIRWNDDNKFFTKTFVLRVDFKIQFITDFLLFHFMFFFSFFLFVSFSLWMCVHRAPNKSINKFVFASTFLFFKFSFRRRRICGCDWTLR